MSEATTKMLERLNDRMSKTRTTIFNLNNKTKKDKEAIECQEYLLRILTEIKYGKF